MSSRVLGGLWQCLDRRSTFVAGSIVVLGLTIVALPRGPVQIPPDRARAAELVRAFNARVSTGALYPELETIGGNARAHLGRDLFRPLGRYAHAASGGGLTGRSGDGSDPAVSAVLLDGDRRQAVLFGRIVAEGDSVNGHWVAEISTTSVLLWKGGRFERIPYRRTP